ncbi:MAG: hypothetical protein LBB23_04060 [Rickettsiales bacterium]|nr:hypothetical protein [Rickettsiales bacterium]
MFSQKILVNFSSRRVISAHYLRKPDTLWTSSPPQVGFPRYWTACRAVAIDLGFFALY